MMYPGIFARWHSRRHAECGDSACGVAESAACGPCGAREGFWSAHTGPEIFASHFRHDGGGGTNADDPVSAFGVRRPLRFLAFKLDLDERQVTELASIMSELKTERAQAAVDHRRTTSALADAVAAEAFDAAKVKSATSDRVRSDEQVQSAVARALGRIHALLAPEQRTKLAYLLRTGALSI
ncbi:MAG: Spy/CpxP family protein refolding chaperone [Polyangiaceae bacterium]